MYIGPDVVGPLATALAAAAGVVLLFWRKTVGIIRSIGHAVGRLFGKR